jgi:molybdopterin molybdotransferase
MIALDEALALLLEGVTPLACELVPIGECGGRTLAADVIAARAQPPDPVSAMDGYAVQAEDARRGAELTVIGEAPAGAPFAGEVMAGAAVRIATGGVVPPGADRIVIQEDVDRTGDRIRIREQQGGATWVRAAGSDFQAGETVVRTGETLTPARLALAAAANHALLEVRRRPRVAILASGDELREPRAELEPGNIVNSAGLAVAELVRGWGGMPIRHAILPDDREACANALEAADLDVDIIVPLGGASVGDRDALRPLFQAMGARILFERIAVQPGKPSWNARFDDGRLVLGLPGNPASAFVCAHLLLRPLIARLLGRQGGAPLFKAQLAEGLPACGARETYLRGRLSVRSEGQLIVTADTRQDSSLQTPLAAANALIRRLPNAAVAEVGEMVEVLLIGELAQADLP